MRFLFVMGPFLLSACSGRATVADTDTGRSVTARASHVVLVPRVETAVAPEGVHPAVVEPIAEPVAHPIVVEAR